MAGSGNIQQFGKSYSIFYKSFMPIRYFNNENRTVFSACCWRLMSWGFPLFGFISNQITPITPLRSALPTVYSYI